MTVPSAPIFLLSMSNLIMEKNKLNIFLLYLYLIILHNFVLHQKMLGSSNLFIYAISLHLMVRKKFLDFFFLIDILGAEKIENYILTSKI